MVVLRCFGCDWGVTVPDEEAALDEVRQHNAECGGLVVAHNVAVESAQKPQEREKRAKAWPECRCCGGRAQTLYKGEPMCYACARYLKEHDDECPPKVRLI